MNEKTVKIETDDTELFGLVSVFLRDDGIDTVTEGKCDLVVIDTECNTAKVPHSGAVLYISDSEIGDISRPFSREELVFAVREKLGAEKHSRESVRFDGKRRRVYRKKLYASFTEKEYAILRLLYEADGDPVDRQRLAEIACKNGDGDKTNAVDVFICGIRKKLFAVFGENVIKTVRGRGYAMNPLK